MSAKLNSSTPIEPAVLRGRSGRRRRISLPAILTTLLSCGACFAESLEETEQDVQIIEREDRTVYEYRQNGLVLAMKVVPKSGPAYYMVPADGSVPMEGIDHARHLYPSWIIVEW